MLTLLFRGINFSFPASLLSLDLKSMRYGKWLTISLNSISLADPLLGAVTDKDEIFAENIHLDSPTDLQLIKPVTFTPKF